MKELIISIASSEKFNLNYVFFLHSADVMNRNENFLLFRMLHVEVGGLCLIFDFSHKSIQELRTCNLAGLPSVNYWL